MKGLAELIAVSLFAIGPISGHIREVVFASKPHEKDQQMSDKFFSWFGYSVNVFYYCIDEAFSLIEKHHGFVFSTTTKQMLFSFGFSPSGRFLQTGHC